MKTLLRRLFCLHIYGWPASVRYDYSTPGYNRVCGTFCNLCGKRKMWLKGKGRWHFA